MKYRIKESEELVTRWKGGRLASESIEKVYQIEFRQDCFLGRLVGWSERGAFLFTEEEAREKIEYYKKLDREPPFKKREATYIEID